MGWLTGWTYRKSVTISRASGAVTNYQMKLLVGESSGASGEDVDCGGHCLASFNDLRFTASDGVTLLDYWIESISGTTPNQLATVWIEFDSIGTSATTFYMYYGNSGASSVSSGADTFITFDDFERGSDGDTIGGAWTETVPHVHISTEQDIGDLPGYTGSRAALLVGSSSAYPDTTISQLAADGTYAIRWRWYKEDASTNLQLSHGNGSYFINLRTDNTEQIQYFDGTDWVETGYYIGGGAWNLLGICNINFTAGTFDIYRNDSLIKSGAIMASGTARENLILMRGSNVTGEDGWFDNFIVSNWRSTGPAFGSWGSEEEASGGAYEETIGESLVLADEIRYFAETIEDLLGIADRFSHEWATIEEPIDFADAFYSIWEDELEESLSFADEGTQGLIFPNVIEENAVLADSGSYTSIFSLSQLDTIFIYDTPLPSWARTIADSLSLADSGATLMGVSISDWLWLIDSHVNKWKGQQVVPEERLSLYDLPGGVKVVNRSLAETIDLADSVSLRFLLRLLEYMRFTDLASAVGKFKKGAADAILLADAPSRAFDRLVEETLTAIDSSAALAAFLSALTDDSLKFSDASTSGSHASKAVSDALFIGDAAGSGLLAFTIVQDSISLNVLVEIEGELYECYVLNTPKFLPSVYSGFDFNSYCTFEGKTYGANATGIYELAGGTDAGTVIQTGVVMPQTTFGIPDSKKLRRAWLGITGTSPALVLEVEDGTRKAYAIDSYGEVGSDREISGKKWKLSIANFDELDFIRILPVALVR